MRTTQQLQDLTGRVAIVTGGAGHLGQAIASAYAENGAAVALVDRSAGALEEAKKTLSAQGSDVVTIEADITNADDVRRIPETVQRELGGIDVLVHCAALVGTSELDGWVAPFEEQQLGAWNAAVDVNMSAPFFLTQACIEPLRAQGRGAVVMIGSIYGVVGPDMSIYGDNARMGNPAAYAATKGGLTQLSRWMSTVLAPEVRVNTISIGGVFRGHADEFVERYTRKTPLGRMATEEDIKGAALFLGSDLSRYVTGQNLMVDGGWTAW